MAFTLPDLPYASRRAETLHVAPKPSNSTTTSIIWPMSTTATTALKGTEWEGKPLEEVVEDSFGKNAPLFNNAAQDYNHTLFWKWMKPNGGGAIPGRGSKRRSSTRSGLGRKSQGRVHPGGRIAVRLGLGLARRQGWQGSWSAKRPTAKIRSFTAPSSDPRRRCLGALLLPRLPQSPAGYLKALSKISSTGNMSPSCSARSKLPAATPPASSRRRPASVSQVQRLLGADIDVGRIHRLTVAKCTVQVDAAVEGPCGSSSRRVIAGLRARPALSSSLASRSRPPAAGRDRPCASS